jgi:hypothetical protein
MPAALQIRTRDAWARLALTKAKAATPRASIAGSSGVASNPTGIIKDELSHERTTPCYDAVSTGFLVRIVIGWSRIERALDIAVAAVYGKAPRPLAK